jgi:hypothetical protein
VSITRARPVIRTQPLIPNTLGELVMMQVMPANAPIAMTALMAGSVASSNLIYMEGALGGGGGGLKIRSVLLIY